jgi:hypothetical protein
MERTKMPLSENARERAYQLAKLREIHGRIGDEWGEEYFPVIHAVEEAISAMENAKPDEEPGK